ncbi:hypothetical protein PRIC1_005148 [Phytophthora ramorum]
MKTPPAADASSAMADLPPFRFHEEELHKLQEALPRDLHILRLRLRFGLPIRAQLGQRFRVVVDLVDEMGQPISKDLPPPSGIDISLATPGSAFTNNHKSSPIDSNQILLKVEDELTSQGTTQLQAKWVYWISLHNATASADICSEVPVSIMIQSKQTPVACSSSSSAKDSRCQLRSFCVGSSWLSERVLVLPLRVDLQVTSSSQVDRAATTSTSCHRMFRSSLSTSPAAALDNKERGLLVIEENYGDAMGSHVWDASILLGFAVIRAGINTPLQQKLTRNKTKQAILELGSGCGLFAAVLTAHLSSDTRWTTIFTEKPECTERLQTNLDRNEPPASSSVLPLEWGAPLLKELREADVRVVFAADVLYHWAAHEAFLATLDSLVGEQESSTKLHVFLAHKRRGKASATKLDALASGTFDSAAHCGAAIDTSNCRWLHWQVEKVASIGRVDLYILS